MKFIHRQDIDTKKWDQRISESNIENVFQYSWYLDAVCPGWGALITSGYETILPVAHTTRLGVRRMIQANFTREYTIVGNEFNWDKALQFLRPEFKTLHFRCGDQLEISTVKSRLHQWISLKTDFEKNYSNNAKRILKKATNFDLKPSEKPELLLDLFKEHVAHKIETLNSKDLKHLAQLMRNSLEKKQGELFLVYSQNELVAGGFFLLDKSRITYLKGASSEKAKKDGSMYFLIDQVMKHYKQDYSTFDFGGSDVDNVAEFYHKFGADDRIYYDYNVGEVPRWYGALKKLKP